MTRVVNFTEDSGSVKISVPVCWVKEQTFIVSLHIGLLSNTRAEFFTPRTVIMR
jgi:hypothetical protein